MDSFRGNYYAELRSDVLDKQSKYKLYVTGIAGLLGNNIASCLSGMCEITGVDIIDTLIPNITYEKYSLFDTDRLREHIKTINPDAVIHTAALVNVDECEEDPEKAWKLNDETTGVIADICDDLGIKMVYISTDAVFSGGGNQLHLEDDVTAPLNVYAQTKLAGEKRVLKYSYNLVFRTNIYGHNIQNKKSFGEWILSALENNQELNMFDDVYFSPILVTDLAMIIYKALLKDLSGLYHVCSTGSISKYDFAIKLKKEFDIDTGIINRTASENAHLKAKRSKNMGMSNEKIKKALGIEIRTPEESIAEFRRIFNEEMI